jgi:hypothetical protein
LKVLSDKKAIVRSQSGTISRNSAVLVSLKEGYQIFERDLSKLQVIHYRMLLQALLIDFLAIY